MVRSGHKPKLLFLVNADWYFWSHRLPLARAARDHGFDVVVVTQEFDHGSRIRDESFSLVPVIFPRAAESPLSDLRLLANLNRIYRSERPDIAHHVSLKPVVFGSLVARGVGCHTVNALTGLGYVFTSRDRKARVLREVVTPLLRFALNHPRSHVIVQNGDDEKLLREEGVIRSNRLTLIPGSGVDTDEFLPLPSRPVNDPPVVVAACRMLWDKGIADFVQAARQVAESGVRARFVLVGPVDEGNPAAIPKARLDGWHREGVVEWVGPRDRMEEVLGQADVVCLPSYREGLPKVLIEAASCGCAIVTNDVPGCREVVQAGVNGLLVPPRNVPALAAAITSLLADPALAARLGRAARRRAIDRFAVDRVVEQTLGVYDRVVSGAA